VKRTQDNDLQRADGCGRMVLGGAQCGARIVELFPRSPIRILFPRVGDGALEEAAIAAAIMGDPSASIPNPQPEYYRPMFGAFGRALTESSVTFVSQAALEKSAMYGLAKKLLPVANTRNIGKHSMVLNSATPRMEVNPETYEVRADGRLLTCQPAQVLSMAQRYFLY
jgi:urease subunit alpha